MLTFTGCGYIVPVSRFVETLACAIPSAEGRILRAHLFGSGNLSTDICINFPLGVTIFGCPNNPVQSVTERTAYGSPNGPGLESSSHLIPEIDPRERSATTSSLGLLLAFHKPHLERSGLIRN